MIRRSKASFFTIIVIVISIISLWKIKRYHDFIIIEQDNQLKDIKSLYEHQKNLIDNWIKNYESQLNKSEKTYDKIDKIINETIAPKITAYKLHIIAINLLIEDYELLLSSIEDKKRTNNKKKSFVKNTYKNKKDKKDKKNSLFPFYNKSWENIISKVGLISKFQHGPSSEYIRDIDLSPYSECRTRVNFYKIESTAEVLNTYLKWFSNKTYDKDFFRQEIIEYLSYEQAMELFKILIDKHRAKTITEEELNLMMFISKLDDDNTMDKGLAYVASIVKENLLNSLTIKELISKVKSETNFSIYDAVNKEKIMYIDYLSNNGKVKIFNVNNSNYIIRLQCTSGAGIYKTVLECR